MTDSIVLPFPSPIVEARHVRSTVLLSSLAAFRAAGYFERYVQILPIEFHEVILNTVAGVWLPMTVALAHYGACESLGLSADAQAAMGRETFERSKGTLLGTAVRLAQNAGVSPWTVLPHFQRFWMRGYDGGGIRVTQIGPKEAQVDLVAFELLQFVYYRNALGGLISGVLGLFCQRVYVKARRTNPRAAREASFRAQWV